VSASSLAHTRRSATPAALDEAGMARIRDAFVAKAERAAELGFDTVELDLGEGYLLGSFLSPRSNRRTDAYGKDPLRFPRSVVEAARAAFAGPLAVRLSEGGYAAALRDAGADLVHVAAGQVKEYRRGHLTAFSDRIRSEANVATMVGGYLDTLDAANTIVGAGRGDLCVLERAALT
jgi:anthraniloyl-CoA monooxygenase